MHEDAFPPVCSSFGIETAPSDELLIDGEVRTLTVWGEARVLAGLGVTDFSSAPAWLPADTVGGELELVVPGARLLDHDENDLSFVVRCNAHVCLVFQLREDGGRPCMATPCLVVARGEDGRLAIYTTIGYLPAIGRVVASDGVARLARRLHLTMLRLGTPEYLIEDDAALSLLFDPPLRQGMTRTALDEIVSTLAHATLTIDHPTTISVTSKPDKRLEGPVRHGVLFQSPGGSVRDCNVLRACLSSIIDHYAPHGLQTRDKLFPQGLVLQAGGRARVARLPPVTSRSVLVSPPSALERAAHMAALPVVLSRLEHDAPALRRLVSELLVFSSQE